MGRFKDKLILAVHGLFHGLKGADEVIAQNASYGGGGTEIVQNKISNSVYSDMLQQKETQRVREERDRYYRVLREADKYSVSVIGISENDDDSTDTPIRAVARKKVAADYLKHSIIFNDENYEIRLIQDNKLIPAESNFSGDFSKAESEQVVSLIGIDRDDFIPRFKIENYTKRMVVKTKPDNKARIDLYVSMYASQFGKVDALFVSEINRIREHGLMRSDTTAIKRIYLATDKAFGADDLSYFEYNNIIFVGVEVFDGNFVLQFDADVVVDGAFIGDKYKTEELSKKYEENAPKKDAVDIFAVKRKIEKEENDINLDTTTFRLS